MAGSRSTAEDSRPLGGGGWLADEDVHVQHHFRGEPDEDLIDSLEPDQLVSAMDLPVPRRRLSRPVESALWALRIFLVTMTLAVVYVFVRGVAAGSG